MVYDVTNKDSFDHVRDWLAEVNRYANEDTCKLLIGNKNDRTDKAVSTNEGERTAEELKMPFLEASARTAENVEAAFIKMAEELISMRDARGPDEAADTIKATAEDGKKRKAKCC